MGIVPSYTSTGASLKPKRRSSAAGKRMSATVTPGTVWKLKAVAMRFSSAGAAELICQPSAMLTSSVAESSEPGSEGSRESFTVSPTLPVGAELWALAEQGKRLPLKHPAIRRMNFNLTYRYSFFNSGINLWNYRSTFKCHRVEA